MKATAQIFLSYAREDREKVEKLYQKLSNAGFKPWMDKKDILPGERWQSSIRKAIRCSDFFLACLSANSVSKRGFLQKEVRQALDMWQEKLEEDIYLIPVRLEDCEVPESLRGFHWVNLFEEAGWTRLVKAIQVGMERRAEVTADEEPSPSTEMAVPEESPERVPISYDYCNGEFEMKVFLSHSSLDKELAGQVKVELAYYGLEVFLAHEDIEPLAEWIDVIFAELKDCDVFMPILTENFDGSKWTDQETGIAYVGEKLIIPLKVAVDPHGFIANIQALRLHAGNVKAACKRVARVIASKPGFGDLFRDALIRKFGGSGSYDGAGDNIRLLLSVEGYTSAQVREMVEFTIANGQINQSGSAHGKLLEFVRKYKDLIEPELYRAFREAIGAPVGF